MFAWPRAGHLEDTIPAPHQRQDKLGPPVSTHRRGHRAGLEEGSSFDRDHKMNQAKKQCLGFKKLTLGKMDSHCKHAELMLD